MNTARPEITESPKFKARRGPSAKTSRCTLQRGVKKNTLWLFLAVLLCSCSSIVEIKETRMASVPPPAKYQKVLIAGITPNFSTRSSFENIFAETLNTHGVAAVASHTLISDLSKAGEAHFQDAANQVGADAVIITRVLSHSEHEEYLLATGHVEYRAVDETNTKENSSTTIAMAGIGIVPGEVDTAGATLQTNLFDAASGKLVWTAMSSASGADNGMMDVCWELSALLTKALSKDRLIVINSKDFKIPKL